MKTEPQAAERDCEVRERLLAACKEALVYVQPIVETQARTPYDAAVKLRDTLEDAIAIANATEGT